MDTDGIRAYDASIFQSQIQKLNAQLQKALQECEDLRLVRQCNNHELIELEQKRHALTLQNADLSKQVRQLQEDKATLLGYLEEREVIFHETNIGKETQIQN